MNIYNFSAGPSKIPQTVVDQLAKDIINYKDFGYSVLELSHRSQAFEDILYDTKKHLVDIEVLKIERLVGCSLREE